ncbi:hypothetical protein, partial [Thiorhodococcus fuscus]
METSFKTLVVRCDIHKLYILWNTDPHVNLTISEYFAVQLAYIVVKYRRQSADYQEWLAVLRTKKVLIDPVYPQAEQFQLDEAILDLENAIEEESTEPEWGARYPSANMPEIKSSGIFRRLFEYAEETETNLVNRRKLQRLGEEIINYIGRNGWRLLKILDGVDNIHLTNERTKSFYAQALEQTKALVDKVRQHNDKCILLLSIRTPTLRDLWTRNNAPISHGIIVYEPDPDCLIHSCIRHLPLNPEIILERKLSVAGDPKADLLRDSWEKLPPRAKIEDLELLKKIARKYISLIQEESRLIALDEGLFSQDLRAITRNILSLFRLAQKTADIADKRFWYIRNLYLNGNSYISTGGASRGEMEIGQVIPNPFVYIAAQHSNIDNTRWYGLCGVRILQYLWVAPDLEIIELKTQICKWFEYPKEIFDEFFARFAEYGLIIFDYHSASENALGGPGVQSRSIPHPAITVRLSGLGAFVLKRVVCDTDNLYFFALDTPLSIPLHRTLSVRWCVVFPEIFWSR